MKNPRPLEPGLLRIFRYFTGIALVYFTFIILYTFVQTGANFTSALIQSYLNFAINLGLFGYLSWGWLRRKLRHLYLPIALVVATVLPIFTNLIYLTDPQGEDLATTITRSWLLLPILLVPLVLIAWQYRFRYVVAFILFTALAEMSVLLPVVGEINFETIPILGVPLIRAFAFGTVGHIVTQLIDTQRMQRKELLRTNLRLSQAMQTLEQMAVVRERNRLARELHDTLAHTLSGQAVNLEAIKLMIPDEKKEIHHMLDEALKNVRHGLAETRRALRDLRAGVLDDYGLPMALRQLGRDAASRGGFSLHLDIDDDILPLTPDIEQCFYRIAQEALENVIRHANASQVTLRLVQGDNQLVLEVQDDGEGFDIHSIDKENHMGLRGMHERAEMVGANLMVDAQPSLGTLVRLSVEVIHD